MKEVHYMEAAKEISEKYSSNGGFLVVKTGEKRNTMTVSWWNIGYIWARPVLTVAVRKTRYTFALIEASEDFCLSIPLPDMPKELAGAGAQSGRDIDKFEELHLPLADAQRVNSPIIDVPGFHYECRILLRSPMDPAGMNDELEAFYPEKDYHTMYFGEILSCYRL
ncbi:MAG: flavin reductase family protein [Desulfobacterales bacterium]|nr:flavin reductase family protein [Desulfobacterales bacterium]